MSMPTYIGYEPPNFTNEPSQTGLWFRIVAEPDTFTGERFNIGIGIVDNAGNRLVRVITEKGRLECAFGTNDAETILMMAEAARKCFEQGVAPLFENITYDEPVALFNRAPLLALEELFYDQVTFAHPRRSEKVKHEGWLTREETRTQIYQLIRERAPAQRAEMLIPQVQEMSVNTNNGSSKYVKVPLQPVGGAAGLESACYSPVSVKTHLLDAILDLQTYVGSAKVKNVGMFVLRPSSGISELQKLQIDNTIDDVIWRAPKGWKIDIEYDVTTLADKIIEWSEFQAA